MDRILIKNACIVTVDKTLGNLPSGDLLIENGTIREVSTSITAADAQIIDGTGKIVMPGLIDAHRHFWEGGFRAVTADWSILDFLGNIRFMAASFFRPEDMYATAWLGGLEALDAGVTTVADYCHNVRSPDHASETLRGVREAAVRCVWGYGFIPLAQTGGGFAGPADRLAFLRKLAADEFASRDGLVTLGICPKEVFLWGTETQSALEQFAFAKEASLRVFMHCKSRPQANGNPREAWRLHELGLVSDALTLIHMGATDADEWKALGDAGASVCYSPETEYQMNLGWPSSAAPKASGTNLCLGTDMTANNSADMFFPLRMFLQVERSVLSKETGDPNLSMAPISCSEALEWATIRGAKALGLDDRIGSLVPKKRADIVMLKADGLSMAGWDRRKPETAIVQHAGVNVVDTVFVDGRIVKRDGRMLASTADACRAQEATVAHIHKQAEAAGGFDADMALLNRRMGR